MNSKRAVTLPKSILDRLASKPATKSNLSQHGHGVVLLRFIVHDIRMLKVIVPKPTKSVSVESMNLEVRKMRRP